MLGISLEGAPGIGDMIQFTSMPENYFKATGKKLIDVDKAWVFDHNPYVVRNEQPKEIINLWKFPLDKIKYPGRPIYTSLAERNALMLSVPVSLAHPRLYKFEECESSGTVIVHTTGTQAVHTWRGYDQAMILNEEIIRHIKLKYHGYAMIQVGGKDDVPVPGAADLRGKTDDVWRLVGLIAQASVFIGPDSGPSWIAACYPRVQTKKVLMQAPPEYFDNYIPMKVTDPSTHWHDSCFRYYNRSKRDAGMTLSYLKL